MHSEGLYMYMCIIWASYSINVDSSIHTTDNGIVEIWIVVLQSILTKQINKIMHVKMIHLYLLKFIKKSR